MRVVVLEAKLRVWAFTEGEVGASLEKVSGRRSM